MQPRRGGARAKALLVALRCAAEPQVAGSIPATVKAKSENSRVSRFWPTSRISKGSKLVRSAQLRRVSSPRPCFDAVNTKSIKSAHVRPMSEPQTGQLEKSSFDFCISSCLSARCLFLVGYQALAYCSQRLN